MLFPLFTALLLTVGISIATPIVPEQQNVGNATSSNSTIKMPTRNNGGNMTAAARCYDQKMASIFNSGLAHYAHNMGQLATYILQNIQSARIRGSWLVHAEMIGHQQEHVDWQSLTNGDLYNLRGSTHGCYYHDSVTFIVAVRYA